MAHTVRVMQASPLSNLKNNHGVENFIVEFSDCSPYFVDDRIKALKEAGQYGMPIKLEYASLLNETPMKERGMAFLEATLGLGVTDWTTPLVSSNTQTGLSENGDGSDGAPVKDDADISSDGVATRDKK